MLLSRTNMEFATETRQQLFYNKEKLLGRRPLGAHFGKALGT